MFIMTIITIFTLLSFILGLLLGLTTYYLEFKQDPIVDALNELLPQSQCAQCGHSGCYLYAKAIIENNEKINKCIPGGNDLLLKIAQLLNIQKSIKNLKFKNNKILHHTVFIDENNCVGCSKCASFCPVDAIIGAPNYMHTVLQEFCTGCNICLLHCPTNCIKIKNECL